MKRAGAAVLVAALIAAAPVARAQDVPTPRYGDQGTSEISLGLGASSNGFAAAAGFRYFVIDGVAPGLEGAFQRWSGYTQGSVFASVRLVPLRFTALSFVFTPRVGRLFLADHGDGWAAGGDVGALIMLSPYVGFEVGYQVLRLFPGSFCDDLTSCTLRQPILGIRITF